MAMLAEPRRKQKVINLRAKNNAWSNDSSKFGQRMLEKMGWTSGKGLGANENGITEHVIAKYKNDEKGLGFEDKNDQWTKHEDDFNALLANLSNASDSTENIRSGISLEDKSKKSKARIHYHKFTRGKDISRYSEKDLANIFGKKSFKNTEEAQVPLKEDLKTTEQIFTEKGSMEDYFKNKLAEFKSKSKFKMTTVNENDPEYDEPSYGFSGFAQENDDNMEVSGKSNCNQGNKSTNTCNSENIKSKKKKSKILDAYNTCGNYNENSNDINEHQHNINQNQEHVDGNRKKKNKNKIQVEDKEEVCDIEEFTERKIKKKKSKSKQKLVENSGEELLPNITNGNEMSVQSDLEQTFKNKKKSKKNANTGSSSNTEFNDVSVEQNTETKSFKNKGGSEETSLSTNIVKKKNSKRKIDQNCKDVLQDNTEVEILPKKKKKKKCKELE